jgi:arylsulfate sulfotransferase
LVVPPTQNAATTEGFAVNGLGGLANIAPFGFTISPSLTQVTQPEDEYCPEAGYSFLMTRVLPNTSTLFGVYSNHTTQDYAYQTLNVTSGAVSVLSTLTLSQVNQQLAAQSLQQVLDFNHEVMQLPSGNTAVLAHEEELVPCSVYPTECWTGYTEPEVDILGDQVLVLDPNGNLLWAWNAFSCPNCGQELSIGNRAVLGEKCVQGPPQYCPITLATEADDWLHMNSISYDPADGNLVVSIRHQDAIIKIAYQNGSGDGHIVWRLGHDGGFKMINSLDIPSPWFSHQHDVEVVSDNPLTLSLFDNGNTRHASNASALSRVQVLTVDESKNTVNIAFNYDLPVYSSSYGGVQALINGNWWVLAGNIPTDPKLSTRRVMRLLQRE